MLGVVTGILGVVTGMLGVVAGMLGVVAGMLGVVEGRSEYCIRIPVTYYKAKTYLLELSMAW